MPALPKALERLVVEFAKLPGVGRRGAERMAFGLLSAPRERAADLGAALDALREQVGLCPVCGYFTDCDVCPVCGDASRDDSVLCVVEDPLDVVAFEKAGGFRGRYHVLGGVLSPLKGVGPDRLRLGALGERLDSAEPPVTELILATSPSVEGDATALWIARHFEHPGLSITRIGRGVPVGGSLEHADGGTLRLALDGRRPVDAR
jgi:recombination protein RecR